MKIFKRILAIIFDIAFAYLYCFVVQFVYPALADVGSWWWRFPTVILTGLFLLIIGFGITFYTFYDEKN